MGLFQKYYFSFSPLILCRIVGRSMEPTVHAGAKVLVVKHWILPIHPHAIVVACDPRNKELLIKRVKTIKDKKIFVVGDNENESTDSRDFGWIDKKNIIGKVIKIIQ